MLADLLVANVYQTLLVFARVGAAIMVLPGFGEGFVFPRARLALALLVAVVVAPVVAPGLPPMPAGDGAALGLVADGEEDSVLPGPKGNREIFLWFGAPGSGSGAPAPMTPDCPM